MSRVYFKWAFKNTYSSIDIWVHESRVVLMQNGSFMGMEIWYGKYGHKVRTGINRISLQQNGKTK